MSIPAKQIGWSNKSNLLYEVLKQLNKLNKQICCDINNTTSTTSSTTTTLTFTRKSFLLFLNASFRQGFVAQRNGWWNGNTVSSIAVTNPDYVLMATRGDESTGAHTIKITRSIAENISSPIQSVSPTYTTFDSITGAGILISVKELYKFAVKLVNNTFLQNRNPSIFIKRVSRNLGGINCDGLFLVGIDFDATGNERDGYDYVDVYYNSTSLPATITLPFSYNSIYNTQSSLASNVPMGLYSPSTSWVNGVTNIIGTTITENFPIPPGW